MDLHATNRIQFWHNKFTFINDFPWNTSDVVVTHGYISYHLLVIIICFLRIPARIFGCVYVLIALIAMPVDITCFFAYKIGRVMVKSKKIKSTFKNQYVWQWIKSFFLFIWNNTGDKSVKTVVIFIILGYKV